MTTPRLNTCHHCGISFRWQPLEHESGELTFCCRGCLGAYLLICGAGLDAYYQRGNRTAPTVAADTPAFNAQELAAAVLEEGPLCRMDIYIAGISCSSCIWLLERIIGGMAGVTAVSLTHSTATASVRYDPALVSPIDIFAAIARLGYVPRPYSPDLSAAQAKQEHRDLLIRLGTSFFLTMQLMAYSFALYAGYFQGMSPTMKQVMQLFSFVVATPVVFYCGWPFFRGAWRGIRSRSAGMDLLIVIGAGSAWSLSIWQAINGNETYFESAAMIVTFVLAGRLLESSVRQKGARGLEALYAAAPQYATRLEQGVPREVAAADISQGDLVLVRQGERFPVDVLILEGETEVDQSLITGESMPVMASPGDEIKAGCINSAAPVTGQALRPVGMSYLMRVAALVRMAQAGKPDIQRLADLVAARFVPTVILLAILSFLVLHFSLATPVGQSLLTALTIVLIACPCAFGLAVPTAVLSACSRSAALGIILRGGDVLERLARIDTLLLDKTGTVTRGRPEVVAWRLVTDMDEGEFFSIAASVEHPAPHPLARAIERCAAEQGFLPGSCHDFLTIPGRGVSASLTDGRRVVCGSLRFMEEQGMDLSLLPNPGLLEGTAVVMAIDGTVVGYFILIDSLRPGAHELSRFCKHNAMETWLVSGDRVELVARTAATLNLDRAKGEMTPDCKLDLIRDLQARGQHVLMVGDGINDAPALAAAQVGCSISGSSDIALESADMIIAGTDLSQVALACRMARSAMGIIRQNLAWAFIYNIIGIPLAMCGKLTPVYAAAAMTISSLTVSLNSLRLMRIRK